LILAYYSKIIFFQDKGSNKINIFCYISESEAVHDFSSQVSPELYGDSRPRLFTYWTVRIIYLLLLHVYPFYLFSIHI
jgi:hypothetical protein